MRIIVFAFLALAVAGSNCASPTRPSPAADVDQTTATQIRQAAVEQGALEGAAAGGTSRANGGGLFLITLSTEEVLVHFSMGAVAPPPGGAVGRFHHRAELGGLHVEFDGQVTCLSVDPVNHRAWIGGVITKNDSEHPSFTTPRTQVGRDIWFRVLNSGTGQGEPDRSTFVGFAGDAGIQTSAEYCAVKPWPDANARTWPVVQGSISVEP